MCTITCTMNNMYYNNMYNMYDNIHNEQYVQ